MPDGRMGRRRRHRRAGPPRPVCAQCQARGLWLAADGCSPWRAGSPTATCPRFDVPFLVARMPEGQTPVADEAEQFEPQWVRPQEA